MRPSFAHHTPDNGNRSTEQFSPAESRSFRTLRGIATVRLSDGTIHTGEVHWYEAHGIGRKEFKLKFPLLD